MYAIRRVLAVLIGSAAFSAAFPAGAVAQVRDEMSFVLAIDGCDAGLGTFSQVTGLDSTLDLAEYRSGGAANADRWYYPGLTKYGTVTLHRASQGDADVVTRCVETLAASGQRATATIALLDLDRQRVAIWTLEGVFPLHWTVPPADEGTSVGIETLVLSHEGVLTFCPRCSQ